MLWLCSKSTVATMISCCVRGLWESAHFSAQFSCHIPKLLRNQMNLDLSSEAATRGVLCKKMKFFWGKYIHWSILMTCSWRYYFDIYNYYYITCHQVTSKNFQKHLFKVTDGLFMIRTFFNFKQSKQLLIKTYLQ